MDPAVLLLPGNQEWILIILAIILLFGAAAIPKLARSLGRAQGEFQKARQEFNKEVQAGQRDAGPSPQEEERRIRAAAEQLGIETEGKSLDEVKQALNQKVG